MRSKRDKLARVGYAAKRRDHYKCEFSGSNGVRRSGFEKLTFSLTTSPPT